MSYRDDSIPRYYLYGEDAEARPFEFVHVERLRDRSEPRDWTIDVHTHIGLAQLAVFLEGGVELHLDATTSTVRAPAAVTIPSGAAHALDVVPGSQGYVVMLADDHLDQARLGRWLHDTLFSRSVMLSLDRSNSSQAEHLCEQLVREQQALEVAHDAVTQWLALSLLTLLARRADTSAGSASGQLDRFRDFRRLVEEHFHEHRSVSWYAGRLHLSESSLNRLCDSAGGTTAFEVVQGRLELEARRRLRYTTAPVTTLAHELGFRDQSYFSRFFRRRTGRSPSDFRLADQAILDDAAVASAEPSTLAAR